jgi:hypothetical protein
MDIIFVWLCYIFIRIFKLCITLDYEYFMVLNFMVYLWSQMYGCYIFYICYFLFFINQLEKCFKGNLVEL